MSLKLPSEFSKKIADVLDFKAEAVEEWFDIFEDKSGFFVAALRPKKWLSDLQFKGMCALARDLNGEYVKEGKAFKVPGPFAKKAPQTSSTPSSVPASIPKSAPKQSSPEISQSSALAISALSEDEDVQSLRGSSKKIGSLYPVLVDSSGNVIDGYHRLKANPDWPRFTVNGIEDPVQLARARLIANQRRNVPPEEKTQLLREILAFTGWTPTRMSQELGWSESTVYCYWPPELKDSAKVEAGKMGSSAPRVGAGMDKSVSSETLKPQDVTVGKAKEILDTPAGKEVLEEAIRERAGQSPGGEAGESEGNEPLYAEGIKTVPEPGSESVPKEHGPAKESVSSSTAKPALKSEEKLDTGFVWECPECHEKFGLIHVKGIDGKIKHCLEAR